MNSGEICHHAKMFMGAGEEKIAEMIQQEQGAAGASRAGTSYDRNKPGRSKPGQEQSRQEQSRQEQSKQEQARQERARQEQPRQEQARQEQLQQEQPWKNGSEYQTTKCSAYQVEYKCITIVSGAERTGERR